MNELQEKRGPGRPRTGRKPRIDTTISQEALDFMTWLLGPQGNWSAFLEDRVKAHPRYQEWKDQERSSDGIHRL